MTTTETMMNIMRNHIREWEKAGIIPIIRTRVHPKSNTPCIKKEVK